MKKMDCSFYEIKQYTFSCAFNYRTNFFKTPCAGVSNFFKTPYPVLAGLLTRNLPASDAYIHQLQLQLMY